MTYLPFDYSIQLCGLASLTGKKHGHRRVAMKLPSGPTFDCIVDAFPSFRNFSRGCFQTWVTGLAREHGFVWVLTLRPKIIPTCQERQQDLFTLRAVLAVDHAERHHSPNSAEHQKKAWVRWKRCPVSIIRSQWWCCGPRQGVNPYNYSHQQIAATVMNIPA
jgi:hypothetical protein